MRHLSYQCLGIALLAASAAGAQTLAPSELTASGHLDGRAREITTHVAVAERQESVDARLSLAVDAGANTPAAGDLRRWNDLDLLAAANWTSRPLRLSLEAQSKLAQPAGGGFRSDAGARANATLTPDPSLALELAGEVLQSDVALGDANAPQISRFTDTVAANLQWKPLPGLSLKASQRLEDANLAWRGQGALQAAATVDLPSVEIAAKPWQGADLSLAYGRTASDFDSNSFAVVAAANRALDPVQLGRAYRANQAWRLAVTAVHSLGPAKLKVGISDSQLISSLEDGGGAPVLVAGGHRSDVSLGFEWPLRLEDGALAKLAGDWVQRSSSLRDPITGALRPVSGEQAFDGRLELSLADAASTWRWGLGANLKGASTDFMASRLRTIGPQSSLTSYVELHAADTALRLQLDNLLNETPRVLETDFLRDRASGQIISSDRTALDSAAPRLTLTLTRRI